jgi:uncharacterized protein (DUF2236 family)
LIAAVDESSFERGLAALRAENPVAGFFGPGSATWLVDREAALFLGAGRALLLQLAHPWVAAAIAEHSRALDDPIGRFHRTFGIVFALVFGTADEALAAARRLHRRHAGISGAMPAEAGPFPAGSPYAANEAAALFWVHATLVDTALLARALVLPPLVDEERDRYYDESRRLGILYGIPAGALPAQWREFAAWRDAMLQSEALTVTPAARRIADALLRGAGPPRWYLALTAELLPERLRAAFGLPFGERERAAAARATRRVGRRYPLLPARLRFVGPYQEASARIAGRRPGWPAQAANLFWIGRRRIAA